MDRSLRGRMQISIPSCALIGMLAAILAFMVARLLGARHLYNALSLNYQFLQKTQEPAPAAHP